jgi:hypothetical protein
MAHIITQENRCQSTYTKTQETQELKDSHQDTGNICRAYRANKRTHETHGRQSSLKNTGYKEAAAPTHEHRKHRIQRAHKRKWDILYSALRAKKKNTVKTGATGLTQEHRKHSVHRAYTRARK